MPTSSTKAGCSHYVLWVALKVSHDVLQESVRAGCDRWEERPLNLSSSSEACFRVVHTYMYMFLLPSQLTFSTSSASALCQDVFTKFDSCKEHKSGGIRCWQHIDKASCSSSVTSSFGVFFQEHFPWRWVALCATSPIDVYRWWSVLAGPHGRHHSALPGEWAGDDTHPLSAELLESEPGLLHWPVRTLDQCHQWDVSDPTAVPGPAKAAAIGAPALGWQMKSKYS